VAREIRTFTDIQALSAAAADEIAAVAKASVKARGRFTIALAGGNTPRRAYELLATTHRDAIDWGRTVVVFGDERFVPPDDPLSNYRMARDALLDRVPVPPEHVHVVPTSAPSAEEAAEQYEATLWTVLGDGGTANTAATEASQIQAGSLGAGGSAVTVDLALLGIGPDGHTASLFPNAPSVHERTRWVLPVDAPTHVQPAVPRVTTTLPFLNAARAVLFLVSGADKRAVLGEILGGGEDARRYPAAMVAPRGRALWMIDQSAMPDDRSRSNT